MTVYEESCTYCDALYEAAIKDVFRGPKDEVVCVECYRLFEYHDIDRALLSISKREKISLRKLAERLQILIITEEK